MKIYPTPTLSSMDSPSSISKHPSLMDLNTDNAPAASMQSRLEFTLSQAKKLGTLKRSKPWTHDEVRRRAADIFDVLDDSLFHEMHLFEALDCDASTSIEKEEFVAAVQDFNLSKVIEMAQVIIENPGLTSVKRSSKRLSRVRFSKIQSENGSTETETDIDTAKNLQAEITKRDAEIKNMRLDLARLRSTLHEEELEKAAVLKRLEVLDLIQRLEKVKGEERQEEDLMTELKSQNADSRRDSKVKDAQEKRSKIERDWIKSQNAELRAEQEKLKMGNSEKQWALGLVVSFVLCALMAVAASMSSVKPLLCGGLNASENNYTGDGCPASCMSSESLLQLAELEEEIISLKAHKLPRAKTTIAELEDELAAQKEEFVRCKKEKRSLEIQCPEIPKCPEIPTCPKIPTCPEIPKCPEVTKCPETTCPKIPKYPEVTKCPETTCPKIPKCPEVTKCPETTCPKIPKCPEVSKCPETTCPKIPKCHEVSKCPGNTKFMKSVVRSENSKSTSLFESVTKDYRPMDEDDFGLEELEFMYRLSSNDGMVLSPGESIVSRNCFDLGINEQPQLQHLLPSPRDMSCRPAFNLHVQFDGNVVISRGALPMEGPLVWTTHTQAVPMKKKSDNETVSYPMHRLRLTRFGILEVINVNRSKTIWVSSRKRGQEGNYQVELASDGHLEISLDGNKTWRSSEDQHIHWLGAMKVAMTR